MRITFIIPFVNLTGGIRVHLDYANELSARGHDVTVVYPCWPYRFQNSWKVQVEEFRRNRQKEPKIEWYFLQARLLRVPLIRSLWLPKSDVVIAIGWPTVKDVDRLPPSRGRKVHIVMHHESGTGPEEQITQNYRLPFYRIAYSQSIAAQIRARFNCQISDVVPNGINTSIFYRETCKRKNKTILMLYHPDPRKGSEDGLRALSELSAKIPGIRIQICGTVKPSHNLPLGTRFIFHPSDEALRHLYSRATILLYPSRVEGFGLPPLEAMACGCPVVTTAVGAVPEYAEDGKNAFVIQPLEIEKMIDRLFSLLKHPTLRERFAAEGLKTASQYSLRNVTPAFEAALLKAIN